MKTCRRLRSLLPAVLPLALGAPALFGQSDFFVQGTHTVSSDETWRFVYIGNGSQSEIDQNAYVLTADGIFVGQTSSGIYKLTGGSVNTGGLIIGNLGAGTFAQSGTSAVTVTGSSLAVGYNRAGTYTLADSATLTAPLLQLGLLADGRFTQTGGTATYSDTVLLGYDSGVTGTYQLSGGTLTTPTVSARAGGGTSVFNFNGGTLRARADSTAFVSGLTTANVQAGGAVIDSNGHNVTISQALLHDTTAGAPALDGGLTKNGAGTLTLTGANTYTGATALNAGTLSVAADANLGAASAALTFDGGTLRVTGTAFTSTARTINWGADGGGFDIADAGNTFTVTASAYFNGGLTKLGAGTLVLAGTGDNANLGATVNAGTLILAKTSSSSPDVHAIGGPGLTINNGATVQLAGTGGDQIYNSATVTVNSGGTLNMNGRNETVGGLNGAGTITGGGGDSTLTVNGGGTYAGTLVNEGFGSLSLIKNGPGTLTLSGGNIGGFNYTVNGGALVITGVATNASGSVRVNSGGTLGGSGTIDTNVTVASGGTLAPGVLTPSTLTIADSNLILQSGSTLAITLGGTTAGSYDEVLVGTYLTLAGSLRVSTVNGFTLAPGQTFTIVDNGEGPTFGTFSNAIGGLLYADAQGDTFLINYAAGADGNDVTLTVLTVVPEPGTWMMLGVGAAGLGLSLGRRRACRTVLV